MGWGWCGRCSDGTLRLENCRGGDFWAAKSKNEPCMLDFGPGCAIPSAMGAGYDTYVMYTVVGPALK
jgi:hypothetical protein